jgi:FAD/FMN-containing dehydrogenase
MALPPSPAQLAELAQRFKGQLLVDEASMHPYLVDWRKRWQGKALAVALPDSTQDVAAVVQWCQQHQVAVVPQGGNTSLSGGAVPDESGRAVVVSLKRMKTIGPVDELNNTMVVQAGAVLQSIQEAAERCNRLFPLSLAAQGSCTIGGNLSTNAGGVQVLRYGNARELCLGLEVVTAEGEIWNGLRGLRKDNTGYDLKDLYIGAEGTLGIITGAVLKLYPLPASKTVALVALDSVQSAMRLFADIRARVGDELTAFELISGFCLSLVTRHFSTCRSPFAQASPWVVLVEVSAATEHTGSRDRLMACLEAALEAETASDVAVSESLAQAKAFWALRENISEAQALEGKNIKHDIAVPISCIAEFVEVASQSITTQHPGCRMVVFGHLGDGNLHFNVSPPAQALTAGSQDEFLSWQEAINTLTHDWVHHFKGSISAEHGLGVLRRDESARYKSAVELALMRRVKQALDPNNLMNPGKVLTT